MRITWTSGTLLEPGVNRGQLQFDNPRLHAYRWPVIDIVGQQPGPRLCVMAGVHVNEASSVEAAATLWRAIDVEHLVGTVSVLPVVNEPGCYDHRAEIPVDGQNLHWLYPGDPAGSFSEALAHSLLFDWAGSADILIDMHGGDLGEDLTPYVVFQRCQEPKIEARNHDFARCFDAPLIYGIDPIGMAAPGRSCAALGRIGRVGLVSEAGRHAMLDPLHVAFHINGVINVARLLGMLPAPQPEPARSQSVLLHDYQFLNAPSSGMAYPAVAAGSRVTTGQPLIELRDHFQDLIAELRSPGEGFVMWITVHLLVKRGEPVCAVGLLPTPVERT